MLEMASIDSQAARPGPLRMRTRMRLMKCPAWALIGLLAVAACTERRAAELPATVAVASAPASAAVPAEVSAANVRMVGLPDFSLLVQKQGPAVVNVITTRAPRSATRPVIGDSGDPLQDFLRRFMPEAPQGGAPSLVAGDLDPALSSAATAIS